MTMAQKNFKEACNDAKIKTLEPGQLENELTKMEKTWKLHRGSWDTADPLFVGFDVFFPAKTYPRDKQGYPQGMDMTKLEEKRKMFLDVLRMVFNRGETIKILDDSVKDVNSVDMTVFSRLQRLVYTIDDAYEIVFRYLRSTERVVSPSSTTMCPSENDKVYRTTCIDVNDEKLAGPVKLLLALYNETDRRNLRKYKNSCYEEIITEDGHHTMAWRKHMSIKDFVYKTFDKESRWEMYKIVASGGAQKAIDMMTNAGDPIAFREIKKNRNMWSFKNGVFIVEEGDSGFPLCQFYPYKSRQFRALDYNMASSKYFDAIGDGYKKTPWEQIETPGLEVIMDYQRWPTDVKKWFYIICGRLCFDLRKYDTWEAMPFLLGMAGAGKSTIVMLLKKFYDHADVKMISNNIQTGFGLSSVLGASMVIAPEVKKDFKLDQAEFQSLTTGEPISLNVKFKEAENLDRWVIPGIMAGNEVPGYTDSQGSILRRLFTFSFGQMIRKGDARGDLEEELDKQLPRILVKCVRAYTEAVPLYGKKRIWDVTPRYFTQVQDNIAAITNPLRFFLQSDDLEYSKENKIPFSKFQSYFKTFCGDKNIKPPSFTTDLYTGPFQQRGLTVAKCKEVYDGEHVSGMFVIGVDVCNVTSHIEMHDM